MKKSFNKNILISSAGRRVELVKIWKEEVLKNIGKDCLVLANDLNPYNSAACNLAHQSFPICAVKDKNYPEILLEECLKRNIGLVVPTIDHELRIFAEYRKIFEENDVQLLISDKRLVNYCRNKNLTFELFKSLGINSPDIFEKDELKYPLIIKPYDGSSSLGIKKIYEKTEISDFDLQKDGNIFQELLSTDWQEFSVDLFYDKKGDLKCAVPRHRIETRGGEISKGITRKNFVYEFIREKLGRLNGARGPMTLQIFANNNKLSAIELNARFGGGYPMSYLSGANFPSMIIKEYLKDEDLIFYDSWEEDKLFVRYDSTIEIKNKL
jgi:carbamoyl-phosphate synthase large subunit